VEDVDTAVEELTKRGLSNLLSVIEKK